VGSTESFVCMFVFLWLCFRLAESVNMRVLSIARRAMIPPRRGIDHSFIVFHMTVMFNLKYSAYTFESKQSNFKQGTRKKTSGRKRLID
jgi:hypothetical protein